jgi:hypothetical protein
MRILTSEEDYRKYLSNGGFLVDKQINRGDYSRYTPPTSYPCYVYMEVGDKREKPTFLYIKTLGRMRQVLIGMKYGE